MQGKSWELRGELEVSKELLKRVDKMEVPPADLDALIRSDQVADQLRKQVAGLKLELEAMQGAPLPERKTRRSRCSRGSCSRPRSNTARSWTN